MNLKIKNPSRVNPKSYRYAVVFGLLLAAPVFAAVDATPAKSEEVPAVASVDAAYLKKLDARVAPIVTSLGVDQEKGARLHALIVAQYRTVNVWHTVNDVRLKELEAVAKGADSEKSATAKREIGDAKAVLKSMHHRFIATLGADLNAEQIEKVKDGMTGGKVQFTYGGYLQVYPNLTDEQKAKVLTFLKDAREEAMDAGSMDEKSAIFNQYKGKINNYLVKQGVTQTKGQKNKPAKNDGAESPSK